MFCNSRYSDWISQRVVGKGETHDVRVVVGDNRCCFIVTRICLKNEMSLTYKEIKCVVPEGVGWGSASGCQRGKEGVRVDA